MEHKARPFVKEPSKMDHKAKPIAKEPTPIVKVVQKKQHKANSLTVVEEPPYPPYIKQM